MWGDIAKRRFTLALYSDVHSDPINLLSTDQKNSARRARELIDRVPLTVSNDFLVLYAKSAIQRTIDFDYEALNLASGQYLTDVAGVWFIFPLTLDTSTGETIDA